jgi:DinB superfamily
MAASAAEVIAYIFAANTGLVAKAFEGVADDQLWARATPENNPILWIAGHMVGTRALILRLLGDPVDEILRVHADLAPRLQARLVALTADDLAREATVGPKPFGAKSFADQLGFFALHDSYHAGQLGYVRKTLGLSNLVG